MVRRYYKTAVVAVLIGGNLGLFASDPVAPTWESSVQKGADLASATAGTKPKLSIKKGDYELTLDGALKIENYFEDNAYLLNKNMPDENEYFKETIDLNLDFCYGEAKYEYDAVEAFLAIRQKGIWGKALSYADRDSGATVGAQVKLDETMFGGHDHYTGKSLLWIKEGWIKFALNPVFGVKGSSYVQYCQIGWFPFLLGRGISLGNGYGFNKEFLGLYTYTGEDKSAPGIDLFGEIVKDTLWYDLYYAKFEERGKSLSDTINLVKADYMGRKATPWRGVNKDDEAVAARLKWIAINNDAFGKLELEPYVMCNFASDQWIELNPDTNTTLGTYGLGLEHAYRDFEWGGEVAFNFGSEKLQSIDRNVPKIGRQEESGTDYDKGGLLYEYYSHIIDSTTNTNARITALSKKAANVDFNCNGNVNGGKIPGYERFVNKSDRFRCAYKNDFRGWMAVADAAYNFRKWDFKAAISWGYASGDFDPHYEEKNKNYNGFIGLHENYCGKRVPSIFILDQRLLKRPLSLQYPYKAKLTDVETDISFSNIQMVGAGFTWSPSYSQNRTVSINPNVIGFWATKRSHKIDYKDNVASVSCDWARNFMGTEANLIVKSEIIKDLTLFGKFAVFSPGGYFEDMQGIPLDGDFFTKLAMPTKDDYDPRLYRLAADTAYHMNLGLEYKF